MKYPRKVPVPRGVRTEQKILIGLHQHSQGRGLLNIPVTWQPNEVSLYHAPYKVAMFSIKFLVGFQNGPNKHP